MSLWKRFVSDPLATSLSQAPWFGFVLTTILVAAMINLATSIIVEWAGAAWALALLAIGIVLTLAFANLFSYRWRRQIAAGQRLIGERPHPAKRLGLIVMVTRAPTMHQAVDYHLPALKHLWLIVTPKMRDLAAELRTYAEERGVTCYAMDLTQEYDANQCYHVIHRVVQTLAAELQLGQADIIADMTGGTKPMTAGMVLACTDYGIALQHVPTLFNLDGRPTVPLPPIEVVFGRPD
jgi:hypothetical protein